MNLATRAIKTVIPDILENIRNSKNETNSDYFIIWELANEIDKLSLTVVEMARSLSMRFEVYAENIKRGYLTGLDQPARSIYLVDMLEAQIALNEKYKILTTIISSSLGQDASKKFEKEIKYL